MAQVDPDAEDVRSASGYNLGCSPVFPLGPERWRRRRAAKVLGFSVPATRLPRRRAVTTGGQTGSRDRPTGGRQL